MKLQPSATMTVETLATEIRRQIAYHVGQPYPFPALLVNTSITTPDQRIGRIEVSGTAGKAIVTLVRGIAHLAWIDASYDPQPLIDRIEKAACARPGNARYLGECKGEAAAEWSAALHVMELFMGGKAETTTA